METVWQYAPYIIPLLLVVIICVAISHYAWRRRTVLGAVMLMFLMLAIAEWSLGYALELGSADLSAKILWGKVQYLGIVATPVAWLAFALQITNRERWLTPRNLALAAIIPLITFLLTWSTESHGLVWSRIALETNGPFPTLDLSYGAWFWIHTVFAYLLLLLGTILIINKMLVRSPRLYRLQTSLLLLVVLAPWVGNGLYILRLTPVPNLDLTPFAFALSGIAMGWDLFRFRLLDVVPVARRTLVEVMSDGVIVLDTHNRIVDLNPAARQIIGYSGSGVVGKTDTEVLSNWPQWIEHYRNVLEGQAEIILDESDEMQCYFDMRISPLYDRQKRLTGRLIVLRDITERKQAERALAQARDHALAASHLKSQLLAKVSHELRTPLGAILGYTELLQDGAFGPLSEPQRTITAEVIDSTQYLTDLVGELLDQAQVETGHVILKMSSFTLKDLVDQVEARMRVLAQAKGLALSFDIAAEMPPLLWGDQQRLQQVLVNLVSNAIKFTRAGAVAVRFYRPDPEYWAMQVADTGPGIPEEAQAYIFEPFRQVDGSMTREHKGTGLGLSIVKQLITLMGGQVTLESEIGQGSTFTAVLPLEMVQVETI